MSKISDLINTLTKAQFVAILLALTIIVIIGNIILSKKYIEAGIVSTDNKQMQSVIDRTTKLQIQTLQEQINSLNATIADIDKKNNNIDIKLADLRRKKKTIKPPQTTQDILERLKGGGYEVNSK